MSQNGRNNGKGEVGSFRVKVGLAQMLKGGVIMDVVTPEQAVALGVPGLRELAYVRLVVEDGGVGGESIQLRRDRLRVSVDSEMVGPQRIDRDQQEVRWRLRGDVTPGQQPESQRGRQGPPPPRAGSVPRKPSRGRTPRSTTSPSSHWPSSSRAKRLRVARGGSRQENLPSTA